MYIQMYVKCTLNSVPKVQWMYILELIKAEWYLDDSLQIIIKALCWIHHNFQPNYVRAGCHLYWTLRGNVRYCSIHNAVYLHVFMFCMYAQYMCTDLDVFLVVTPRSEVSIRIADWKTVTFVPVFYLIQKLLSTQKLFLKIHYR